MNHSALQKPSSASHCYVSPQTLEQLEFDKIIDILQLYCKSSMSRASFDHILFVTNPDTLRHRLQIVHEFTQMLSLGELTGLSEYENIEEQLNYLTKENYVLEAADVLRILTILENFDSFYTSFSKDNKKNHPLAYSFVEIEDYTATPLKVITKVFDRDGEIRPNASSELMRISKRMVSIGHQLDEQFNKILKNLKGQNLLAESPESWRNGRRVLALPIENKRKIEGIIHDQSTSGRTIFIEPQGVTSLNNEVFSLENEKRAEIYRILHTLSKDLSTHRILISNVYTRLIDIDITLAKARLSQSVNGVIPKLTNKPQLQLIDVRHPLLYLQLGNEKTIAFDLKLYQGVRHLLISGPNAGGKSVTLKAVGLIHLMLYAGIPIPVSQESEMGVFSKIFTDIGDQQSIDEGLSTYSSHLHNLNQIVTQADSDSLVLLDEIGSGTDPTLGGAIAEGILRELLYNKTHGVITTHYSSLKVFAFKNKGIVNGAMLFDKENLTPSFKLKVGKPGSSYAFEVANKIGLNKRLIQYARKKVGKKENQVEDLLIDLQEGKAILDEQLEWVANEKDKLVRLINNYEQLNKDFQVKKKKLQIKSKEIKYHQSHQEAIELQSLINQLQEEKNLEKAKKLKEEATQKRRKESERITALKYDVSEARNHQQKLQVGCSVRMLDSDMTGEILAISNKKAEVLFGMMKMWVALIDLIPVATPLEVQRKGVKVTGVAFENHFSPKLDIRGYTIYDAEDSVEEFLDKALLSNARTLEIIHGKGSGALRKLVIRKIKEYKDINKYWHPEQEAGGDGITMVSL